MSGEAINKPLEWIVPDDLKAVSSNWVAVQDDGQQFTISFFEIRRPILLGTAEQNKATLDGMAAIPAVCMARIVMAPNQMGSLIETLRQAFAKHIAAANPKQDPQNDPPVQAKKIRRIQLPTKS